MNNLSFDLITSQLLNLLTQFTIAFLGSFFGIYAKENYEINRKKGKRKIYIRKILNTTVTLSIVLMCGVPFIINKLGLVPTVSLLFLIGASSKRFIEMIFNGELLKIILKFLGKSKKSLEDSINETLQEDKEK